MNNKRCSSHPYHSGNDKVLGALLQVPWDEDQIRISYYITILLVSEVVIISILVFQHPYITYCYVFI